MTAPIMRLYKRNSGTAKMKQEEPENLSIKILKNGTRVQGKMDVICDSVKFAIEKLDELTFDCIIVFAKALSQEEVDKLYDIMVGYKCLYGLDLSRADIGKHDTTRFFRGLLENKSIKYLNLKSNSLGTDGIKGFAQALSENHVLRVVNLYNNGIGDMGMSFLAKAVKTNVTLERLNLGNNILGPKSGVLLAKVLKGHQGIRNLSLWNNSIGDEGAIEFSKTLSDKQTALLELNLFFNEISPKGAELLANALQKNGTLEKLYLASNSLQFRGGRAFAEALRVNTTLRVLDITYCDIGDDAANVIFKGMIDNPNLPLKELYIARNSITEASAELVCQVIQNTSLECLNISKNELNQGCGGIAQVLGFSKTRIRSLFLNQNMGTQLDNKSKAELGTRFVEVFMMENVQYDTLNVRNNAFGTECEALIEEFIQKEDTATRRFIVFDLIFQAISLQDVNPQSLGTVRFKKAGYESIKEVFEQVAYDKIQFSNEAFNMVQQNMFLFLKCLHWIHESLGKAGVNQKRFWSFPMLWCRPGLSQRVPITHLIFQEQFGVLGFCNFLDRKDTVRSDCILTMLNRKDASRTLRQIALANIDPDVQQWALKKGTFLNSFKWEDQPPVHISETCEVKFATDVRLLLHEPVNDTDSNVTSSKVALKLMKFRRDFEREIIARGVRPAQDCDGEDNLVMDGEGKTSFAQTNFRFVLPLREIFTVEKCLVMDRAERSLFDVINTEQVASLDILKIQSIAKSLANGIYEIYKSGFIHADVKPRNLVRLKEGGKVVWKLIDLDASVPLGSNLSDKCSTAYAPPEVAKSLYYHSSSSIPIASSSYDVWSFGVVIYELLAGTSLFLMDRTKDDVVLSDDIAELMNWLTLDDDRLNRINHLYDDEKWVLDDVGAAKDLVKRCLVGDPEKRISIEKLLRHPFLMREPPKAKETVRTPSQILRAARKKTTPVHRSSDTKKVTFTRKGPLLKSRFSNALQPSLSQRSRRSTVTSREHDWGMNTHHMFYSHSQREASAIVQDLQLNGKERRCKAWLDILADDVTEDGMRAGICSSQNFIMVLTKTALFRPFCIKELLWALKAQKTVLCIIEEDARFFKWDGAYVPWLTTDQFRDLLTNRGLPQDATNREVQWFTDNKVNLENSLTEDEMEECLTTVKDTFSSFRGLFYRRRKVESHCMMEKLMEMCNILSPKSEEEELIVSSVDKYTAIIYAKENYGDELFQSLQDYGGKYYIGKRYMFHPQKVKIEKETGVCGELNESDFDCIIFVLTSGVFLKDFEASTDTTLKKDDGNGLAEALCEWWLGDQSRPKPGFHLAVVHDNWDFNGKERDWLKEFHPTLYQNLIVNTEIFPFRLKQANINSQYANINLVHEHEHLAMIEEITLCLAGRKQRPVT
eukprot:CAMPEP_0203762150 /NCGR_PEP_ID=MMETSP0098-20131031/15094_1 /ASSEMBLY_ACC=CAM_ASM_000208 /TAXON_ID=96639 /ORGANISM=" , Strain NY0313808BC1" /LENGTH=1387 /DNA_ID=CAMNT_0050656443 /DNA_START=685 /DNA_END=4848 /DNA_ORIENTATION=+